MAAAGGLTALAGFAWACVVVVNALMGPVGAHDAAPRRDPAVEQRLHQVALRLAAIQPHAIALPVGSRPVRLAGRFHNPGKQFVITRRPVPPPFHDPVQFAQLLASHGRL
jgi:hypothetical protein